MKTVAYTIVFFLAVAGYKAVSIRSKCQESGCPCGSFCVDTNDKWCNSDSDADCKCKEGCMVFDRFLNRGEGDRVHCNRCNCAEQSVRGVPACTRMAYCTPENFIAGVDYPSWGVHRYCSKYLY